MLEQLAVQFGEDRIAGVSRELTKIHEENKTGTLKDLIGFYKGKSIKGEIVVVVSGKND